MPRYYFHLQADAGRLEDEVGMPLPDAEAAFYQAVRSARELIRAELALGGRWERHMIVIADDKGAPVERLELEEVARYAM
jgi:hypothetical protein